MLGRGVFSVNWCCLSVLLSVEHVDIQSTTDVLVGLEIVQEKVNQGLFRLARGVFSKKPFGIIPESGGEFFGGSGDRSCNGQLFQSVTETGSNSPFLIFFLRS